MDGVGVSNALRILDLRFALSVVGGVFTVGVGVFGGEDRRV